MAHEPETVISTSHRNDSDRSTILTQPFHNDPADQIIVATAQEENGILLTKDRKLLDYAHVRSLW